MNKKLLTQDYKVQYRTYSQGIELTKKKNQESFEGKTSDLIRSQEEPW